MSLEASGDPKLSMWATLADILMHRMDDFIYLQLLGISSSCSMIIRYMPAGRAREIFGAFVGAGIMYYFIGLRMLYSLVAVVVNIIICSSVRNRHLALISFIITFTYLAFLQAFHFSGFLAFTPHTNTAFLLITLRLVGLSCEIQDARNKQARAVIEKKAFIEEPSWFETLFYAYSYPGLFTGPYYTYAKHRDVISGASIVHFSMQYHRQTWRNYNIFWAFPAFVLVLYIFPIDRIRRHEFYDETIVYKIYVSMITFFWMRYRVYSAWMIAKSACMLNGIQLRSEVIYQDAALGFGGIKKAESGRGKVILTSDVLKNVRNGPIISRRMQAWNEWILHWFAADGHECFPRVFGFVLMVLVCIFWREIHSGFYLGFFTVVLFALAERRIVSVVLERADAKCLHYFRATQYLARQFGIAYLISGFLLLTYKDMVRYWQSMHFFIQFIFGTAICFVWLCRALCVDAETDEFLRRAKVCASEGKGNSGGMKLNGTAKTQARIEDCLRMKKEL